MLSQFSAEEREGAPPLIEVPYQRPGWTEPVAEAPFVAASENPRLLRGAVADYPEIQEFDINPLLVSSEGVIALDAVAALDRQAQWNADGRYDHMAIRPYPEQFTRRRQLPARPVEPAWPFFARPGFLRIRPLFRPGCRHRLPVSSFLPR